ncbi:protealysin inhibitor emfourin [Streptomyces sp. NPDC049040]|uniref:protealysin inhibitor emfourin n=1 Tax=Streptomyces sp. NPDC049040 TaxID=3365593 RepID=UPI00371BA792
MRIEVTRSGGFAGLTRHAALDTGDRPDAGRLHALAEAALAPSGANRGPYPDGYSYTITADGGTVHCADGDLTPAQRELIAEVLGEGA